MSYIHCVDICDDTATQECTARRKLKQKLLQYVLSSRLSDLLPAIFENNTSWQTFEEVFETLLPEKSNTKRNHQVLPELMVFFVSDACFRFQLTRVFGD